MLLLLSQSMYMSSQSCFQPIKYTNISTLTLFQSLSQRSSTQLFSRHSCVHLSMWQTTTWVRRDLIVNDSALVAAADIPADSSVNLHRIATSVSNIPRALMDGTMVSQSLICASDDCISYQLAFSETRAFSTWAVLQERLYASWMQVLDPRPAKGGAVGLHQAVSYVSPWECDSAITSMYYLATSSFLIRNGIVTNELLHPFEIFILCRESFIFGPIRREDDRDPLTRCSCLIFPFELEFTHAKSHHSNNGCLVIGRMLLIGLHHKMYIPLFMFHYMGKIYFSLDVDSGTLAGFLYHGNSKHSDSLVSGHGITVWILRFDAVILVGTVVSDSADDTADDTDGRVFGLGNVVSERIEKPCRAARLARDGEAASYSPFALNYLLLGNLLALCIVNVSYLAGNRSPTSESFKSWYSKFWKNVVGTDFSPDILLLHLHYIIFSPFVATKTHSTSRSMSRRHSEPIFRDVQEPLWRLLILTAAMLVIGARGVSAEPDVAPILIPVSPTKVNPLRLGSRRKPHHAEPTLTIRWSVSNSDGSIGFPSVVTGIGSGRLLLMAFLWKKQLLRPIIVFSGPLKKERRLRNSAFITLNKLGELDAVPPYFVSENLDLARIKPPSLSKTTLFLQIPPPFIIERFSSLGYTILFSFDLLDNVEDMSSNEPVYPKHDARCLIRRSHKIPLLICFRLSIARHVHLIRLNHFPQILYRGLGVLQHDMTVWPGLVVSPSPFAAEEGNFVKRNLLFTYGLDEGDICAVQLRWRYEAVSMSFRRNILALIGIYESYVPIEWYQCTASEHTSPNMALILDKRLWLLALSLNSVLSLAVYTFPPKSLVNVEGYLGQDVSASPLLSLNLIQGAGSAEGGSRCLHEQSGWLPWGSDIRDTPILSLFSTTGRENYTLMTSLSSSPRTCSTVTRKYLTVGGGSEKRTKDRKVKDGEKGMHKLGYVAVETGTGRYHRRRRFKGRDQPHPLLRAGRVAHEYPKAETSEAGAGTKLR
ncbi:uncharacterized protein BDR25DRAFT_354529 [Lindgomyces ingoldianus]|uniref:Uncharacterized protein n=1 Tax=Lindgomyces ingoldianus TaxID=673940 RepID=A0ACB6QWA6_9PLEO|nr:uncharacterized protein BDR25DRAFT_354529 [Lindgomyces ingoldianus]KAF2471284.1 hypothetical protein BDR25DRAFT_354529 [Lindgomyces ingoldianus]